MNGCVVCVGVVSHEDPHNQGHRLAHDMYRFRLTAALCLLVTTASESTAAAADEPAHVFTVLLQVHSRRARILPWLEQYAGHPLVHEIVLQTKNDFTIDVESLSSSTAHDLSNVRVVPSPRNSLNDRFLPHEHIATDAVLVVDDDVVWPHAASACGAGVDSPPHFDQLFEHYLAHPHHRNRVIGFQRRGIKQDSSLQVYTLPLESCQAFHMVLTSAALLPTSLLRAYWDMSPRMVAARAFVDARMNCEDILMNFVAQNASAPPVAIGTVGQCLELTDVSSLRRSDPELEPGGESSLSARPEHYAARSECLNYFASTTFKATLPHGLAPGEATKPADAAACPIISLSPRVAHQLASALTPQFPAAAAGCQQLVSRTEPLFAKRLQHMGLLPHAPAVAAKQEHTTPETRKRAQKQRKRS